MLNGSVATTKLWHTHIAQQAACIALLLFSLVWLVISTVMEWDAMSLAYGALALVAIFCTLKLMSKKERPTVIVEEILFFAIILCFTVVFDVPNEDAPRVSHIFFLVLAMYSYITYLRWKSCLRLIVVFACVCGFVIFSSTTILAPYAFPIPDDIRLAWSFSNVLMETLLLCGGFYAIQSELVSNRKMARELRAAAKNGELELYFQPQVDQSARLVGAEALLRWNHPRHGLVSPAVFIPVAEENGLMPLIGTWVLNEACRTLMTWSEHPSLRDLTLAVNVSPEQFNEADFLRSVQDAAALYQIDPGKLKLELTESVIISRMDEVITKMNALQAEGYSFALDDFGTGYSSLSYLRNLPLRQLKIDRSFVQSSAESAKGASIVKGIVQLGRDLDLVVLAEGIETEDQFSFMRDCGCREFQGYFFGRPVKGTDFKAEALR